MCERLRVLGRAGLAWVVSISMAIGCAAESGEPPTESELSADGTGKSDTTGLKLAVDVTETLSITGSSVGTVEFKLKVSSGRIDYSGPMYLFEYHPCDGVGLMTDANNIDVITGNWFTGESQEHTSTPVELAIYYEDANGKWSNWGVPGCASVVDLLAESHRGRIRAMCQPGSDDSITLDRATSGLGEARRIGIVPFGRVAESGRYSATIAIGPGAAPASLVEPVLGADGKPTGVRLKPGTECR